MQPSLPVEILAQIVDSLYAQETTCESEPSSPTLPKLIFASRALRGCALRNLCRTVVVDCDDDKPNDKLRDILISGPRNPRLESVAPFIQSLQINLRHCTSSSAALDELSTLLAFILKQCPLRTVILEGTYFDEDRPESESEYNLSWQELPSAIHGAIDAFMPVVRSLEIHSISGLCEDLFAQNHSIESLLISFSKIPAGLALANLRRIVVKDLAPEQVDSARNICNNARESLEELYIDDDFWNLDVDTIRLQHSPNTIPDSLHLHSFPKLEKFTYFHNYWDWGDYPLCPQISFFLVKGVVPELRSLLLCVRMDEIFYTGARSVKEAISRAIDPSWGILDSLLASTDFPKLQQVRLALEERVKLSIEDFVLDADGAPCHAATKLALQHQITDSIYLSFPQLKISTLIDLKIEVVVYLQPIHLTAYVRAHRTTDVCPRTQSLE